ncbi:uncharacterized protein PFL1_05200 [Pseudozyma flocculosa PF-1]|uniref:Uncharacterized protein n=2 Tax=Pseudozyma flocculosa TaxID=84751 RepID=A0A5C3F581_9BASI|nr:uncharacterized protein PFL1_05200 [Pseudozyma flocculosa PF-1]EPQ27277.1 hypothetical protein PFL1_05200 [Pseudozyma flocculosa PF-1]SPO39648.1 uncharacterized protein PSFLO_05129 [Pseudozyma flocculosa]
MSDTSIPEPTSSAAPAAAPAPSSVDSEPAAAAAAAATAPGESSTDSTSVDAETLARQKREARKARILSKGSDRLARITNTGRGEGASAYLDASSPLGPSRPSSAVSSTPASPAPGAATARAGAAAPGADEDPMEVDISTLPTISSEQVRRGEAASGNPFLDMGGAGGPSGNPMEALMAMMQGQGAGGGGPFGAGGPGMGPEGAQGPPNLEGLPPQLAAMLQNMPGFGGGAGGAGAGPGGDAQGPPTALRVKTLPERLFDVLQAGLVVLLAIYFARSSLFNDDHSSFASDVASASTLHTSATSATSTLHRWARLGYERPLESEWTLTNLSLSLGAGGTAFPLFWIFITLEIALQAMRVVLFSSKTPPPPSMLGMLAGLVPIPNFALYVRLAAKYVALINAFVNDLAVVVFVFGLAVLWAGWKVGIDAVGPAAALVRDEL